MHDLAALLPLGVAPRNDISLASSASSVARWTADGDVVHLHPGVLVLPHLVNDPVARARAATLWAKGPLSHVWAVAAWGATPWPEGPVHVTVSADRFPRRTQNVKVHRTTVEMPTTTVEGIPVTHLGRSLVDAWSWAHSPRRNREAGYDRPLVRQAVIECVRDRGLSVAAVRRESAALRSRPGRRELEQLLDLVAGGCESELEIWGVQNVLPGPPTAPAWVQQHRLTLPDGRRVKLDAAYLDVRVAVELDGAAFHGSRSARERDLRRDTALATAGWIVLRFSYARLISDPEGCRREIQAVILSRLGHH